MPPSHISASVPVATRQPGIGKKAIPITARTWIASKYQNVLRSPSAAFHHGAFHGSGPRLEMMGALSGGTCVRSVIRRPQQGVWVHDSAVTGLSPLVTGLCYLPRGILPP